MIVQVVTLTWIALAMSDIREEHVLWKYPRIHLSGGDKYVIHLLIEVLRCVLSRDIFNILKAPNC